MNCARKFNPSGSGVYKRVGASQRLLHGVINRQMDHRIMAQAELVDRISGKQQMVAGVKVGHPHLAGVGRCRFVFLKHVKQRHSLRHPMSVG